MVRGLRAGRRRARPGPRETKSLGLYTLGRIFEQSITELEILEADADERPSLNRENKRKRDGVYYTPEWVVERIVAETVGGRLADLKAECGWPAAGSDRLPDDAALNRFDTGLREIRIVDPACGSGAFLITALRHLLDEWTVLRSMRRDRAIKQAPPKEGWRKALADEKTHVIRDILLRNIYGVDINPASVEIAKLALWLHTARGDQPLSGLDDHIRDGNSLIGPEFYDGLAPYGDEEKERINAFDWRAAFPEVFERGGFDAVVGNPPYVKLQNFRKVHADMAAFLARSPAQGGRYASTQTGNFDLYLPFIEKGVALLNENGRLGYIAPSLWPANDYGGGLRRKIGQGRNLYGWIDFGSWQVFEEATTYTALQFFSRRPNDAVRVAKAPEGVIPKEPGSANDCLLPYDRIDFGDRWLLATGPERDLIDRLTATCQRLDDPRLTRAIYQGLITSADHIYHLTRQGPGRYLCSPKGRGAPPPYEVRLEDEIMRPLVSGPEAKRYVEPLTETFLLFPYRVDTERARLIPAADMAARYPLAWAYLRSWEADLRARESEGFDDDQWWRFGRHQNLDKQEIEKLIVAQTVPSLRLCADAEAILYQQCPGQRHLPRAWREPVVSPRSHERAGRRFRVPKDRSAEGRRLLRGEQAVHRPPADPRRTRSGPRGRCRPCRTLTGLHSERRDLLAEIGRRMSVVPLRARPDDWLFPDLPALAHLDGKAPAHLDRTERRAWAKKEREEELNGRLDRLGESLRPGVSMDARFEEGELRYFIDGVPIIERVFLRPDQGVFVLAQWKLVASSFAITDSTTGKKLADALRKVALTAPDAVREQIIDRELALSAVEAEIDLAEAEMNARVYQLYMLTPEELSLVEAG